MGKGGPIWWERGAYLVREGAYLVGGGGSIWWGKEGQFDGSWGPIWWVRETYFGGGEWGLFGGEGGPI